MQGDKIFLDTNIIIYAYDVTAGKKHEIAGKVMSDLWDSGLGALSTQVLQEFFVNVTKKIPKPLDVKLAKEIVTDLLRWDVVVNDGESILNGVEIHLQYQYSFWDSLIIEAATRCGAKLLLSEDLSDGQIINGVTIKNPF
ncbi:MAG: PIN domain-containing protein [Pseudomonadota bacterium]